MGVSEEVHDLDTLPFLDFSSFPAAAYGDKLFISSSRGCVRNCAFCTHVIDAKSFRTMSARRTVAEIRHQLQLHPSYQVVEFCDSVVNGDIQRLAELAALLADYRGERLVSHPGVGFAWTGQGVFHPAMTAPLLQSLRRSGCLRLSYGLESGSQRVVDLMRKGFRITDAERVLRATHQAGILAQVYLMAGFPGETEDDFQESLAFLERNAPFLDAVSVSSLEIQKGSWLDRHAIDYGVQPLEDRARWATRDGSSTWEIREERVGRAQKTAERLGLTTNRSFNRSRVGDFFLQ
jgi:radical SAM superfamily enzyme YgiQ (UPF0313 family)